jgi:protein tyrosine/serine phosphatase
MQPHTFMSKRVEAKKRSATEILYNFHWIIPGEAARSAQGLGRRFERLLQGHGIRSLLNLRGEQQRDAWWRKEQRLCERLAIARYDVSLDSRRLPMREMLVALVDAFGVAKPPVLVKCSGGQDRTALAAAIYLLHRRGWSALPDARLQFLRFPYLHFPKRGQKWLEQFPDYAESAAQSRPIAEWIRDGYDQNAFANWLRDRGMGDSFKGLFTLPWTPNRPRWRRIWN